MDKHGIELTAPVDVAIRRLFSTDGDPVSVCQAFHQGSDLQEGVSGQKEIDTRYENNERPRDVGTRD